MDKFGVIFDMDGVLVNSTKYIWESFNHALKPYGVHFSNKDIKKYLGLSLRDDLELWKKEYGIELEFDKFSEDTLKIQLNLLKNAKVDLNLLKLLQELKSKDIPMGVGTSSLRWRAERILKILNIYNYFLTMVTAEDVTNHKPNPDLFLEVAKRMKIAPENCVVIEDASSGIEAAKRGKMKAIGLITEYNNKKELKDSDLIIKDFSELSYKKIKNLFEK